MRRLGSVAVGTALALALGAVSVMSSSSTTSARPRHETLGEFVSSQSGVVPLGWQRSTGVSQTAWATAVTDETVKVGSTGRSFVVEPRVPAQTPLGPSQRAAPVHTDIALTEAFTLHSRPGSTKVIYLDFTGQTMTNTAWSPSSPLVVPPYSIDEYSTFSSEEKQNIIDAWSAVAEDYSMFDVDVTTADPGQSAIDRTSYADTNYGVRAVITDEGNGIAETTCQSACQGIAYIATYDYVDPYGNWQFYSPAFAFSRDTFTGKILSDVISHEVGHNLGLSHDGQARDAYYMGRNGWAPIMGAGYNQPLVQWSNGDYSRSTNREDDFAVMRSHGLSLVGDDYGNTSSTAATVSINTSTSGTIHSRTDVDFFRFVPSSASVDIEVSLPSYGPDLDVSLTVLDSSNRTVAAADPSFAMLDENSMTGLTASVTVNVTPGETYFVSVDGVGFGRASSTGYSDYGSVGEYRLSVSGDTRPTLTPGTPSISGTARFGETLTGNVGTWGAGVSTATEWFVGDTATGDTDNTYVVQPDDVGSSISFRVTASKTDYQDSVVSATTGPIVAAEMDVTDTPAISGVLRVGNTLTVDVGSWESGATTTQRWRRNGSPISSATGTSYVLQRSDRGKRISVTVTATKPGYASVTATSAATGKVAK